MRLGDVLLVFLCLSACGGGKKTVVEPDLGVQLGADFSSGGRLGDSCVEDDQCNTKHCITVTEWPNGPFHICGQRCGGTDGGIPRGEGGTGRAVRGFLLQCPRGRGAMLMGDA